jgi:Tfp pilus assembly protein PilF
MRIVPCPSAEPVSELASHDPDRHSAGDGAPIPAALIDRELARITRSKSFQPSRRHQQLLRHLVTQAVAGNAGALKEPLLAHEVFERPLDAFDPARDTIVRVEARRLRQRLARYYVEEGRGAALEIRLPVGSYVPTVLRRNGVDPTATRRARDLVERGDYFLQLPLSQRTLEQARDRFEHALRESPDHVPALVGLGRAWLNLATGWYREPAEASSYAGEALRRALELEPAHALAHALLACVAHQFEYDWQEARRNFQRAIELAPSQSFVHAAYGYHLLARGDYPESDRELSLARQLDPNYVNHRIHMVNLRMGQGRLDHAEAELAALVDIAPESMPAAGTAGVLALVRGDARAAIAHYERACTLAPDHPNVYASLAAACGAAGDLDRADALVAETRARFGDRCLSPYVLAVVATHCGRPDDAFGYLEQAIAVRDPSVMMLPGDVSFRSLRSDPRWVPLLALRQPAQPAG